MAQFLRLPNHRVSNDRGFMKTFVFLLALAAPIAATAVPTTPESLEARENRDTTPAKLQSRANWTFNCYAPGQACRGMGATSGGGAGTAGCAPISSQGCDQFSFDGGGNWKLVVYNEPNCAGEVVVSVNGGSVSCLALGNSEAYLVAAAD